MTLRRIVLVALIGIAVLAYWAWSRNTTPPPAPMPSGAAAPSSDTPRVVVESGGDPGVAWDVPGRWGHAEGNPMRLATYSVAAAHGDATGAECGVYYFGPGQGGDVQTNIDRWIGEFVDPSKQDRVSRTVDGMPVSTVRVRGTHLAHAGMGDDKARAHYELYAAIVEGPQGSLFFKLLGPEHTVDAAASEFDRLVGSLKKK